MASGSRRKRGSDEYLFIDGRAMRSDEVVRIELNEDTTTLVPGSDDAATAPGMTVSGVQDARRYKRKQSATSRDTNTLQRDFKALQEEDAFALTDEAAKSGISLQQTTRLMREDRRIMRRKYLVFGLVLLVVFIFSSCMSFTLTHTFYTPLELVASIQGWLRVVYTQVAHPDFVVSVRREAITSLPYYSDCINSLWLSLRLVICGAMLALSGMLYQNTFRNPIAAPSMLGVTNGINFALLILVVQYGYSASYYSDLYYLYSLIGGLLVLVLVMLGGKWISGKGQFNVVNMILMGTILSQLFGVIITYVQAFWFDDTSYYVYNQLINATNSTSAWTYATLFIGALVSFVPVFLFRFRLNLISFADDESRLLGENPNRLRLIALGCGTVMILVAQVNVGQVAMASLIVPFIVRAIFGSEFRKQLGGNLIVGALVLLVCGDVGNLITFEGLSVGTGTVVSVIAIPLFVWMVVIRQKSWE